MSLKNLDIDHKKLDARSVAPFLKKNWWTAWELQFHTSSTNGIFLKGEIYDCTCQLTLSHNYSNHTVCKLCIQYKFPHLYVAVIQRSASD